MLRVYREHAAPIQALWQPPVGVRYLSNPPGMGTIRKQAGDETSDDRGQPVKKRGSDVRVNSSKKDQGSTRNIYFCGSADTLVKLALVSYPCEHPSGPWPALPLNVLCAISVTVFLCEMGQDDSLCENYGAVEELEELPSPPKIEIPILHLKPTQVSQFPHEKCKMLPGPFFNVIISKAKLSSTKKLWLCLAVVLKVNFVSVGPGLEGCMQVLKSKWLNMILTVAPKVELK